MIEDLLREIFGSFSNVFSKDLIIFFAVCIIIAILDGNVKVGVPKLPKIKRDEDEDEWVLVRRHK